MKALGIYIHVPFCMQKCAYCDFYSMSGRDTRGYSGAVIKQIKSFRKFMKDRTVDTVYIGGGTPSMLSAGNISDMLSALREYANVKDDAEITIEANPGTLDGAKLSTYRAAGVNRISMGLQSADDEELFMLSRIHTRDEFENSFLLARMEGFENINIDVMYALPYQTEEKLKGTMDYVMQMSPEHVSFYGLKIEENTPFGRHPHIENTLPNEDAQVKMYLDSCAALESTGYRQYEISNFAKPGHECRHNLKYWHSQEYLGFGPAAHSMFMNRMFSYKKNLDLFMQDPTDMRAMLDENHEISSKELAVQYVMLAFRLTEGVFVRDYNERFGDDFDERYLEKMSPLIEKGLIIKTDTGYRLSRDGMLVSNLILSEILDFDDN